MSEEKILTTASFSSVIHNNEVSDEIVKWGNANGYPVQKAKLVNELEGYVGFAKEYLIIAKRQPPIPGGWDVVVKSFASEQRVIPVNVKEVQAADGSKTYEINKFILKMVDEYRKEGLQIEIGEEASDFYGFAVRELTCTGHPVLINKFEDFIENMR
ncbi:MAG TPA: hypothetical protein IAB06_01940 [Candidatus Avacidaminococcus intestinavium]|uniref:Uncharacterized protein n=1 Tax=Candidatus Avacidaminococcus intestinavium TaxID=2840684 RepID=A0A9D1MNK5_9FIRM|nr:hypothetical protein [Candidatus Avacidaminococcus intestinavium]